MACGALAQVASPSLFGEPRLVVVPELQSAPDSLVLELLDYVKSPEQDVTLVLVHRGGNRGKKLLDTLKKVGVPRVDASPVKRVADKQAFVAAEFARAGGHVNGSARGQCIPLSAKQKALPSSVLRKAGPRYVAVTVGFEPTLAFTPNNISSVAPSAARTRHQRVNFTRCWP